MSLVPSRFSAFVRQGWPRTVSALGASLLVHVAVSRSVAGLPAHRALEERPSFEVETFEPEPEPEPEPKIQPEPEPEPKPEPKLEPKPEPKPEPPPQQPVQEPIEPPPNTAPVAAEAPSNTPPAEPGFLTAGTSDDGLGLPSGQLGSSVRSPVKAPIKAAPVRAAQPPRPAPPRQVNFKDLTEKPRPPRLDDALRRHYPPGARLAGRAGTARVVLAIAPAGNVTEARLVTATEPEFGAACVRTLLGTTWSPPLDLEGRKVATLMPYECRFRVTP